MTAGERQYHLRYWPEEDRVSLSVDVDDGHEARFMVTRRLVRGLIGLLAEIIARRAGPEKGDPPTSVERVNECLRFAHEAAVARSRAGGRIGTGSPAKEPAAPPILINRVDVRGRPGGEISVQLSRDEQVLTLSFSQEALHVFIDSVLRVAAHAQWDITLGQRWLQPSAHPFAAGSGIVFH